MKKITLLVAFFAAFAMNAQNILFEDDFEVYIPGDNVGEDIDVPADYLQYDVDGDGFGWGLANTGNFAQDFTTIYDGNFIMSASFITTGAGGNGGNGALSPNNILVLPSVLIPADATDASITYLVGTGTDPNFFSETYSVQVTPSSAEADILAATPIFMTTIAAQGNEVVELDLTAFAGEEVFVSFRHYDTTDEFILGLDDITIESDGTLSVQDNDFAGLNHFINTDGLHLRANAPLESVTLFNVLGQQVISQRLATTNEVVNISGLNAGVYIATVTVEGQTKSFKIVKK